LTDAQFIAQYEANAASKVAHIEETLEKNKSTLGVISK
jgi:hypothetical protein